MLYILTDTLLIKTNTAKMYTIQCMSTLARCIRVTQYYSILGGVLGIVCKADVIPFLKYWKSLQWHIKRRKECVY